MRTPRMLAVLAHPDDESLGVGGTLAKYASEGVEVFVLTATRGDGGRFRGCSPGDPRHPEPLELANIREAELRAAAAALGVREVSILTYYDQCLDRINPREAVAKIVEHIRRVQPDVVLWLSRDIRTAICPLCDPGPIPAPVLDNSLEYRGDASYRLRAHLKLMGG